MIEDSGEELPVSFSALVPQGFPMWVRWTALDGVRCDGPIIGWEPHDPALEGDPDGPMEWRPVVYDDRINVARCPSGSGFHMIADEDR